MTMRSSPETSDDRNRPMDLPADTLLPLFVYGALKPGMPAFEQLRPLVAQPNLRERVEGELYVRDRLPLLKLNGYRSVEGFLLRWIPGQESQGYAAVCGFEPRKHYQWEVVNVLSGIQANVLVIRFPDKGNPQPVPSSCWRLSDDPAFGPGLEAVQQMVEEINCMPEDEAVWPRFFRSQMAYLLLWSILERLSALCFGPGQDPTRRVERLHELPGMPDAVFAHVNRSDRVSDSRNPDATYKLDPSNAKKCFDYYYQLRSNLSHRGKGVRNEFLKVHNSLQELLAITQQYLGTLQEREEER